MKYLPVLLLATAASLSGAPADRPSLAVPFSNVEPSIQRLGADPAWLAAADIDNLNPPIGKSLPAGQPATKVQLLWTKENLWVHYQCEASAITRLPGVSVTVPPHDLSYFRADCVELFLDPVGDGRAYIEIQVSPDNGIFDGIYLYTANVESDANFIVTGDLTRNEGWFFPEWNLPGLQSATGIHLETSPKGWEAVLAIPAKGLQRLAARQFAAGMSLRANFVRFDYSTRPGQPPAITNWAPVPEGRAHRAPAGMGYLRLQGTDAANTTPP